MKRKFLMLSALLTLVVCGFCLQSCSSEYDEYTTEEYGYYTEEEITEIIALAKEYGMNVKIDKNHYGEKLSLGNFEDEFKSLQSIVGEYEILPIKDDRGKVSYVSQKKGQLLEHSSTRAIEKGSWSGSKYGKYNVSVKVNWDLSKTFRYEMLNAQGTFSDGGKSFSKELTCEFMGGNIGFFGTIRGKTSYGIEIPIHIDNGVVYNYPEGGIYGKFEVIYPED